MKMKMLVTKMLDNDGKWMEIRGLIVCWGYSNSLVDDTLIVDEAKIGRGYGLRKKAINNRCFPYVQQPLYVYSGGVSAKILPIILYHDQCGALNIDRENTTYIAG